MFQDLRHSVRMLLKRPGFTFEEKIAKQQGVMSAASHGATALGTLALVLRQGMKLVVLGLVIGIPASLGVARLLSSMLIGLSTTDALAIGVVSALVMAVALIACYLPARRATRVDPLVTLRYE